MASGRFQVNGSDSGEIGTRAYLAFPPKWTTPPYLSVPSILVRVIGTNGCPAWAPFFALSFRISLAAAELNPDPDSGDETTVV